MDNVDDSGIDSDQKMSTNDRLSDEHVTGSIDVESESPQSPQENSQNRIYAYHKTSDLQKKLDKQRNAYRNTYKPSSQKPAPKRVHILPRSRLKVPLKHQTVPEFAPLSQADQTPLIQIVTDSSEEDEFESPFLGAGGQRSIHQQLLKDGYNLDKTPDDEDLDLIPPRPLHERSACCQFQSLCIIQ